MKGFSLRGNDDILEENIKVRKKHRIPGYISSSKPTVKIIGYSLDNWEMILKVIAVIFTFFGSLNIFLWAFTVSSFNSNDALFILHEEGLGGGIVRMLPISFYAILLCTSAYIFNCAMNFSLDRKYLSEDSILKKSKIFKWIIRIILIIVSIFFYFISALFFYSEPIFSSGGGKISFISSRSGVDNLIKSIEFFLPIVVFVLSCIFLERSVISKKLVKFSYKLLTLCVILLIIIFVYFPFLKYSSGYGTSCAYVSSSRKPDSIRNGGREIENIMSNYHGGEFVFSYYPYNEDKDYVDMMVFNVRLVKNGSIQENDLLNEDSGVLVSVSKESIENRSQESWKCFKM